MQSIAYELAANLPRRSAHLRSEPAAIYWGALSHTDRFYDPKTAWPKYCSNIARIRSLPCGHYPAEQVPDEVYSELSAFFGG